MAEETPVTTDTTKEETEQNPDTTTTDPDIKAVVVPGVPAPEPDVKETPPISEDEASAKTVPMAATRTPVGAIVHYVIDDGKQRGVHRPAIVVDVHNDSAGEERVNLQVLTDGENDYAFYHKGFGGLLSRQDVRHDEETKSTNSWHWLEA